MNPEIQAESQVQTNPAADLFKFRREMGTISRQSAVFFAGTMFTTAAGYLFKLFVARKLGAELLGVYALGMTVVGLLGVFAALGLPSAASRFVAVYTGTGKTDLLRGLLGRSTLFLLIVSSILAAVAVLGSHWISVDLYHTPELARYMPLFGLLLVTGVMGGFCGQVLAGYKDVTRRTVITNFIGSPLMMVLALALILAGTGLSGYIAAQVASAVITLFLLAAVVWKSTPPAARYPLTHLPHLEKEVVHFSAALFGISVLEFLLSQADKILLGVFLNARQVGIYAVAISLVAFVPIALQTVNQIFAPVIADLYARGERVLIGRLFQTLTKWILGLTIPLALVMVVYAHVLMRLFGRDFEAGWPILVIGTFGQLVNCGVGSVNQLLLMSGEQRRLIKIQIVMATIAVALNAALIPWFGIMGAAAAGTMVNIANNLWSLAVVRRVLGVSPHDRSYFALVFPSAASALCIVLLHHWGAGALPGLLLLFLALCMGYIVFIGGSLLFGLNEDDRLVVGAIWYQVRQFLVRPRVNAG